ncbi:arylsulfatase [Paenibacillus mesophilus]|uniref:arylsulfatase n=1 Tax=Paenibacillus mesophilus TaxID=2582849 RepID=UPI001EE3F8D2|nr:arylsulfatase [Paenibacillus mesophilus]
MKKPNILLVMTDQHRRDALGCYGNKIVETPHLDWLAAEGTIFSHAYSCTPSCIPARASLLTGMDPWNTGILGSGRGQGRMGGGFTHTLPGELARAGYHTQGVGKMNFHPQRSLNGFHHTILDESDRVETPGFVSDYEEWFHRNKTGDYGIVDHGVGWNSWMSRPYHAPEFLHPVNWTVNESIRFLEKRDPGVPFFLKTSFSRPHSPYDALPYYYELYDRKELPAPFVGEWAHVHDHPQDAAKPDAWRGKRSDEEIRRARVGYYALIHHIDQQIGRLFMTLRKMGEWDNTVIIFTSDHGDMLGDHHLWRKTYAYEGAAHIPLIVRLPKSMRISTAPIVDSPVCLQDIMPTLLEAAGADIPPTVDGSSLLPLIRDENASWREFVHGEHCTCYSEEQEMQYLTDGLWKYIWFPRLGTEQLFRLSSDPGECTDLSVREEYASELQRWRRRLIAILESRGAGLTEGDRLVCQAGKSPHVSPKYKERMDRWQSTASNK